MMSVIKPLAHFGLLYFLENGRNRIETANIMYIYKIKTVINKYKINILEQSIFYICLPII